MNAESPNIIEQLRRWLRGEARVADEEQLEGIANNDPFLRDALDGYQYFPEGDHTETTERLKQRLRQRTEGSRGVLFGWLPRVAAAALILTVTGAALWYLITPDSAPDTAVSMRESAPEAPVVTEAAPAREAEPVIPPPPVDVAEPATKMAEVRETTAAEDTPKAPRMNRVAPSAASSVKGRVTDAQGAPLAGAEVVLPGTAETQTDSTGAFVISAPTIEEELLINRPGFQPALVPVKEPDSLLIVLEETADEKSPTRSTYARAPQAKGPRSRAEAIKQGGAQPVGGMTAFQNYVRDNQRYQGPDSNTIVLLQFTVRSDSSLHDFQVLYSADPALNDEAIRLLRDGPPWAPTSEAPVSVKQPVVFGQQE